MATYVTFVPTESHSLEREFKLGRIFDPKLNIVSNSIENKYRKGKVQSTLKRGLNVPEIAAMQAYETCFVFGRLGLPGGRAWPRCACVSRAGFRQLMASPASPIDCQDGLVRGGNPWMLAPSGFSAGGRLCADRLTGRDFSIR